MSALAELTAIGRAMKAAYNERLNAGYDRDKERADLDQAFKRACDERGLPRKEWRRLAKAVL